MSHRQYTTTLNIRALLAGETDPCQITIIPRACYTAARKEVPVESPGAASGKRDDRWYDPFSDLLRGAIALAAHTAMLVLVLGAFRGVEKALEWYWGGKEVLLFGKLPVRYVFD